MSTTHRSHSATTPSRDIVTPVPHCIAIRPRAERISATSCWSSAASTSAAVAARSIVNGASAARNACSSVGITVLAQLVLVGALLEQRVRQGAEHGDVGARAVRERARRRARRSRCGADRAPRRARRAARKSRTRRTGSGQRGAVAVRDHRVRADEDRQPGHGRIPHRVQHRIPAHQLGRDEHRRVVDRHRGEERTTPDRGQPLARGDLAGGVVRQAGREVERDGIGPALVDDRVESPAEIREQLVPRAPRGRAPGAGRGGSDA